MDSSILMNGLSFGREKGSAKDNPATRTIGLEPNHTPSSRYKIKHSPAPPAKYTNSLKVKGPNILSSISKNCGTLNCIEFSARLVNFSSGDNLYGSAFGG